MPRLSEIIGHREIVQTLKNAVLRDKVAHAYLLMGPEGLGKKAVARALAGALLCETPREGDACGHCRSCGQNQGGNHPDLHILQPAGTTLKIEQIRELQKQVQFKPYQGQRHVFILEKVDTMTQEAANSFLKTLEEPSSQTVFILTTDQPYALLPTILSRCQQYQFRPLRQQEVVEGLVKYCDLDREAALKLAPLCGGSLGRGMLLAKGEAWPLREKALELSQRLLQMDEIEALNQAAELAEDRGQAAECLAILLLWLRDLLLYHYTKNERLLINQDRLETLLDQAQRYEPDRLMAVIEEIKQARERILANANTRLTLEAMMLKIHSYGG
ncbi:DNA polymerase III subunit delta' [Desulforamulus ferrireducens]|uniref:DNA polymerase III subunit delta' n=1 Tax=Desulforamulus ferrireducens TaxID=1833852 RepID=A0A1S6ISR7_9FIRM|nr:DNA polymerase III subunit delta' [Desulforamulus ferrireducens]AQS57821.1 DNA polymerase III subunit delta' [Desulforamulus ferrireducens]